MNSRSAGQPDPKPMERKPHYGRGMRKLRGVLDVNQKEMAARLDMTSAQLSHLEKQEVWTDDMLQRVSEKLNVPRSGLDYLAAEDDLLQYIIQHNTLSDTCVMVNNGNIYNISNVEKADAILTKIENLVSKLDKNTELMRTVIPKKKE